VLPVSAVPVTNYLLSHLPRSDRQHIQAVCEPVSLTLAEVMAKPGERIHCVHFPLQSHISLTTSTDERNSVEVGLIGSEGMLGISLILGVDESPFHALVQGEGTALRMSAVQFRRQLALSTAWQRLLQRYLFVVMCQLTQTTACTRFHVVERRLARWLLMTQDRAHSDQFHVTHEFLAHMLGVRRVGVPKAASALQSRHLIAYSRGHVTILDRPGLLAASCGCYQADRATYTCTLG
jgi:CRP-like cAMP-binding protein